MSLGTHMATFDLEVEPLEDADEAVALRFKTLATPRTVTRLRMGTADVWLVAHGLGEGGARGPAQVVLVEDSSEGTAALVYGGVHGLVLTAADGTTSREPYLVLAPDAVEAV